MREYEIIIHQPGYLPEIKPYIVYGMEDALTALQKELQYTQEVYNIEEDPPRVNFMDIVGVVVPYGGYLHEALPLVYPLDYR